MRASQPAPAGRLLDEFLQPLEPRRLLFGADHPPADLLPIPRRLGLEEIPRRAVLPEQTAVGLRELFAPLLVGINTRPVLPPRLKRFQSGGPHAPLFDERPGAPDVDGAPDAAGLARCETDRVAALVHAPAYAVDPADAQRLVHGLGPRDARLARALLVIAHPKL